MNEREMTELEKQLACWYSNLPRELKGKLDFDYTDQYECSFYRGDATDVVLWLNENHEELQQHFLAFQKDKDMEKILRYRELAKGYAGDELEFDAEPVVSLGEEPGAWVQSWAWIPMVPKANVEIWGDEDSECPNDWGGWRLHSFCPKHSSFMNPQEHDALKLSDKIKKGMAFRLGYYEHGLCSWFLQGKGAPGTDCQWDGVQYAGILVWEEDEFPYKTKEAAEAAADEYCEVYTNWSNGSVWGYTISSAPGLVGSSCGGFFSLQGLVESVAEELPENTNITWTGFDSESAAELYNKLPNG